MDFMLFYRSTIKKTSEEPSYVQQLQIHGSKFAKTLNGKKQLFGYCMWNIESRWVLCVVDK